MPEPRHFALRRRWMLRNIVKGNHASAAHQRRIHVEITLHTFIGMVTVDEQKVQVLTLQGFSNGAERVRRVRIRGKQLDRASLSDECVNYGRARETQRLHVETH